ncbi:lipoprotein [Salinimonas sp. HHU 13199]|uniref:Lipoprotein n=1 Tax=Salinimonas profundi TaxID=2729140 RepID=A0ABR8LMI1_9ALTE|nr:lipoprotein [Salinimonas profundi]MBD3586500.1 lipoprotein [Salinimonas profundi]
MQKTSRIISLFALTILLVAACGYRGALYLPDEEQSNQRTDPPAQPDTQEDTP